MSKYGGSGPRKLRIGTDGVVGSVHLDDQDISSALQGADLKLRPGCLPEVTLDVIVYDLSSEVEGTVVVPSETRELLVRLGWTPPAEEATDAV